MFVPIVYYMCPSDEFALQWVFFKAIDLCKDYGWPVVAQQQYFSQYSSFQWSDELTDVYGSKKPTITDMEHIVIVPIPKEVEERFQQSSPSITDAFMKTVTDDWTELEDYLVATLQSISEKMKEPIEGLISLKKMPFIENIARRLNTQTIYYEIGPYRYPTYHMTFFLDKKGLFGDASIEQRYSKFVEETKDKRVKILSRKELLALFLRKEYIPYIEIHENKEYDIGIASGYCAPSFTTPFNCISLAEMCSKAQKVCSIDKMCIRTHPGDAYRVMPRYVAEDSSNTSAEFIQKCRRVVCAGSNMGFEASLYGVPAYDLGWSQFGFAINTDLNDLKDIIMDDTLLSYVSFASLIPIELFTDIDFLRYWLKNDSEVELYNYLLDYQLAKIGLKQSDLDVNNRIEVILKARNSLSILPIQIKNETKVAHLNIQISNMAIMIDELNKKMNSIDKEKNNLLKENTVLEEEKRTLEEGLKSTELKNDVLENSLKDTNEKIERLSQEWTCRYNDLEQQYSQVMNSKSYRITKPLRTIRRLFGEKE